MLIEKFALLTRELGRLPIDRELRMKAREEKDFPSQGAFRLLGSRQHFAKRILEYCRAHAAYEDIAPLCAPIAAAQESPSTGDVASKETAIGFVYLVKSGRYYKIGRSNAAGRRQYELGIQMPEKVNPIHTIRTDDPLGIEAYWHQRFDARRQNGEWFDLSSSDVKAFKRRKFM